jgi:hypothetical protein
LLKHRQIGGAVIYPLPKSPKKGLAIFVTKKKVFLYDPREKVRKKIAGFPPACPPQFSARDQKNPPLPSGAGK